jgi:DNA topoisomerase-1
VLRIGKYGPYLEVTEPGEPVPDEQTGELREGETTRRVNLPPDLAPDELTEAKARELVQAPPQTDRVLGVHPETGKTIVAKDGRFGPYVTELEPEEPEGKKAKAAKPRTASLFKSMTPDTVDLATAVQLLDLPRVVGEDPESGEPITAQNGRYGPYLKKGADTRTLPDEDSIFSIDLPGALELFAQPKYGARRASSALKEFDADPVSGKPIRIKDGRFGAYVTDGETNVTVPRGQDPLAIEFADAVQMLADKRAKGPAPKKTAARGRTRATTTKRTSKKA